MHRTVLVLLVLTVAACSSPRPEPVVPVRTDSIHAAPVPRAPAEGGPQALADNRARWETQRPDGYRFTYTRHCFCPPQYRGPFEVTVRGGEVVDATYKGEGEPMDHALAEYQTIDDLLALVAEAYDRDAARVDVTYDARTGQPTEIFIDYDEQMADEELGFSVEAVRPLDG